jgi:hypothetical protein
MHGSVFRMATSSSKRPRSRSRRARAGARAVAAGTPRSATLETAAQDGSEAPGPEPLEPLNEPFDPSDAIEALWYELTRVEALAHAASQTLESMPCGQDPAARRAAERIYVLVMATAESAEAALNVADAQLMRFNEALAAGVRGKQP